jgi:hypothetical protein
MLEIGLRFQNWGVQSTRIKYGWIRGNGSGGGAQKPYTEWNTISWTSIGIPIAFLLGYDFPLKFGIQVSPNVVLFRAKTYYKRQDEDPKARFPDIERDRLFYKSDLLDYVNFTAEFKAG